MLDTLSKRAQAERRRRALLSEGCSTYSMLGSGSGFQRGIVCLCCGFVSWHPNDIAEKFCGLCQEYHAEEQEPKRQPDLLRPHPSEYFVGPS